MTIHQQLLDTLEKLAVSKNLLSVSQTRRGVRPIRADKFLERSRDNRLFREHVPQYKGQPSKPKSKSLQAAEAADQSAAAAPADKTAGLLESTVPPATGEIFDLLVRMGVTTPRQLGNLVGQRVIRRLAPVVSAVPSHLAAAGAGLGVGALGATLLQGSGQQKTAEISDEQALETLKHLQKLENQQPTTGELIRGAVTGAALGSGLGAVNRLITGSTVPVLRQMAAQALTGAVLNGVAPVVRHQWNRSADISELNSYLDQHARDRKGQRVQRKVQQAAPAVKQETK